MAKIPQLTHCCCGCSLETGTRILAWLQIVGGSVGFALCCVNLFLLSNLEEQHKGKVDPSVMHLAQEKMVMTLISSLVSAVIGIILLLGVNQRKPQYVFSFVIVGLLQFLAQIGILIYLMILIGAPVLILMIPLGLNLYFLLVIYSYYREQKHLFGQNVSAHDKLDI